MMERIGFIGLGIMGKPMATNLLTAGYPLVVHDINRTAVNELVEKGAKGANSPTQVAQNCEVVITMLQIRQRLKRWFWEKTVYLNRLLLK